MFGKTKELTDLPEEETPTDIVIDDFFGDEAAVAEAVRMDALHQRVVGIEQQIHSQFTSMAAYAQIAQEQVELVRSESQHATERSEQKIVNLIERERSDRLSGAGATPDVSARLDVLETQVAEIRESLQQCLSNQKALAEAITDLFAQPETPAVPTPTEVELSEPEPVIAEPVDPSLDLFAAPDIATVEPMPAPDGDPLDGPIAGLALD